MYPDDTIKFESPVDVNRHLAQWRTPNSEHTQDAAGHEQEAGRVMSISVVIKFLLSTR